VSQTTMTSKGQITLPAGVRARLKLVQGTEMDVQETPEGNVMLIPRQKKTGDIRSLRGIVSYDGPPVSLEDINRGIQHAVEERLERTK
jgi:antitoxin PrlF